MDNINSIRTIKLENIPENISITSIIDLIKDCEIQKITKDGNAFHLTFFEYFIFYIAYFELKEKLSTLGSNNIKISYEKSEEISPRKLLAFQAGASRSVYFNNIDDGFDELYFRELVQPFGEIENIKFHTEKRHAQIRFSNFESCVKFMEDLSTKDTQNVKFGFHRPKSLNKAFHGNRTLYLGNIQPDVQPENILQHVFCGEIYTLRFLRDRKCAFLTFLNPNSAEAFIEHANKKPIFVRKTRIKVTYGNNSLIPMPAVLSIYKSAASRAIYVYDPQSNCQFENLETRKVFSDKVKYSFFSMNSALQAIEMLRQSYKESDIEYAPDDSALINSSDYISYLLYCEGKSREM